MECGQSQIYSDGKESACSAGDLNSIPGLGRVLGGGASQLLAFSPGKEQAAGVWETCLYFLMMVISLQEPLPSLHPFIYPTWDGLDKQAYSL